MMHRDRQAPESSSAARPARLLVCIAVAISATYACGDDDAIDGAPADDAAAQGDAAGDVPDREFDSGPTPDGGGLLDAGASDGGGDATTVAPHADSGLDGEAPRPDTGPPPRPTSEYCGDAIRDPVLEECDDGSGPEEDSCTSDCRVRAAAVVEPDEAADDAGAPPEIERTLGTAPHVAAASELGLAIVYQLPEDDTGSSLWLQALGPDGALRAAPIDVGQGHAPTPAANPAIAALPDGRYAVAFTDGSAGTPDIAVRIVDAAGAGALVARVAHTSTAGFQQDADLVWIGDELIVAWTDLLDIRYRRFDAKLRPLASDRALASTVAIESSVALAPFGDGFAAAFRANEDGYERIRVIAGGASWSTPPEQTGPIGDRPALVALDDAHLLLLFTVGTDPFGTGTGNVGRLRAAVLSIATPGEVTASPWVSQLEPYASDATVAQGRPSAVSVAGRAYVAWESARPGGGDVQSEVFVARVELDAAQDALVPHPELAMPLDLPHAGAFRNPRVASSPLFPDGALLTVWEQSSGPDGDGTLLMLDLRPSPFVMLTPAAP